MQKPSSDPGEGSKSVSYPPTASKNFFFTNNGIEPLCTLLPLMLIGIKNLIQKDFWQKQKESFRIALLLLVMCSGFGYTEFYRIRKYLPTRNDIARTQTFSNIQPGISVAASSALVPHLALRKWVSNLPNLDTGSGLVDCIIYDVTVDNWPVNGKDWGEWTTEFENLGYQLETTQGTTHYFKLKTGQSCFVAGGH